MNNRPIIKTFPIKHVLSLATLALSYLMLSPAQSEATNFTNLYSFATTGANPPYTNTTGYEPWAGLLLSTNTLFGTTVGGGSNGVGTVFKINADGTGFTNLYIFGGNDGANPYARLALISNTVYGVTLNGGAAGGGTVFKIGTNGKGFTNLYSFSYYDGANPYGLTAYSNVLYGTTSAGGAGGQGTLFRMNPDGTGFTNFYHFGVLSPSGTNADGALCHGEVVIGSNVVYGTTWIGGPAGNGIVFRVNTDGTGFTNLHTFTATLTDASTQAATNADGVNPMSGLVLSSNWLYGTAGAGGNQGLGTVFRVKIDGTGFTTLHSFGYDDGANPEGTLLLTNGTLYGTTEGGGDSGMGTVFEMNTNGSSFNKLFDFGISSGIFPQGVLTLSGKTIYGTAELGGPNTGGTVFALTLPPPSLSIRLSGTNVVLNWNNPAFSLQRASTMTGIFTNVSSGISSYTNSAKSPQLFFRLQ